MAGVTDIFSGVSENTAKKEYSQDGFSESTTYIGDIRVDLIKAVSPKRTWQITKHKVDSGANIADHRVKLPDELTMVILVTDDEVGTDDDNQFQLVSGFPRTWQDKYQELLEYSDVDQLLEIVTPFAVHPSMMVSGLSENPDKDISDGMELVISFEGVKLSTVSFTDIDPSMIPKKRKAKITAEPTAPENEAAKKLSSKASTGTKNTLSKSRESAISSAKRFAEMTAK